MTQSTNPHKTNPQCAKQPCTEFNSTDNTQTGRQTDSSDVASTGSTEQTYESKPK